MFAREGVFILSMKPFIFEFPEFDSIEIMTTADFHLGDSAHAPNVLAEIRDWVKKKKNRFITISGDIFNAALKTSVSDVYSEAKTLDESMEMFGEFIESIGAEKILVCIDGNHDRRVWNAVGCDPVKLVCSRYGVRYAQGEAYMTVKVGKWKERSNGKNRMVSYRLYTTHGVGGGRSAGAKLNNCIRLREIVIADVYIQGHQHDPQFKPERIQEWSSQRNAIVDNYQWFIVSGSCLERDGYAVDKAYPPVVQQSPILTLSGKEKKMKVELEI